MKKYVWPVAVGLMVLSCGKKDEEGGTDARLEDLIARKDVQGIRRYQAAQQRKVDSLTQILQRAEKGLGTLGAGNAQALVSSMVVQPGSFVRYVELQGNVTTDQDVNVTPQFAGLLTLRVQRGQSVGAGQVIGTVADGGLVDQLKQAQIQVSAANFQLQQLRAQADLARIAYQKQAKLWGQKIGSEMQYLQAKTQYEATQKQIGAAQSSVAATQQATEVVKANLAKTVIRAPFSGVVDDIMVQSGQVVAPGMPVVKLISLGRMRVVAQVPENYLAKVRPGTKVLVTLPTLNRTVPSNVRLVGNYINPQNRTFTIEIPMDNLGGLVKPNLLAKVKIESYNNPDAIQIPSQYLYEDADKQPYVFVERNGQARKQPVSVGERSENQVEILQGLSAGSRLITDGSRSLVDGQRVKLNP